MVSSLAHPDRVCGIALTVPRPIPKELLAAMNQPFPSLDSLELHFLPTLDLNFPPPFLRVHPPHLRRLILTNDSDTPASLCHVLSCTISLVDLTLRLDRLFLSPFETQILSHLQGMPLLRRLKLGMRELHTSGTTLDPPNRTKDVLLPKLNFLCFTGHITQLEGLMACLEAPSLQALRITLPDKPLLLAPHLSKFLRKRGKSFSCAQINASSEGIKLFMVTPTHPPFKFIVNDSTSLELLGHVFSAVLARVQVVFLTEPFIPMSVPFLRLGHFRWRRFFEAFRGAKTLRISYGIGSNDVLDIFDLGRRQFSLDILPALKEIELNATMHPDTPTQVDEHDRTAILGWFQELVDAGKKEGHTLNVHWNTDRVHPKHFYDSDTDM